MALGNFIKKEHIILDIKSISKADIIEEMLMCFIQTGDIAADDKETLMTELLNREHKGSTGIGKHLAIPHCKTLLVNEIMACIGIKKEGADFDALDNQPVNIFILTLSPKTSSSSHIQFLAFISNIFQNEENRKVIRELNSKDEVYNFILNKGNMGS